MIKTRKGKKVSVAQQKLLFKLNNCILDLGRFTTATINDVYSKGFHASFLSFTFPPFVFILRLFRHDLVVQVFHEFMRFASSLISTTTVFPADMSGTIVALARLDAYITATASCLQVDGAGTVGKLWQKFYHETYFAYFFIAFDLLVCDIDGFVEKWCSEELFLLKIYLGLKVMFICRFQTQRRS